MIHLKSNPQVDKDWFAGPWDWPVPAAIGYANLAIPEPHAHAQMWEIYLVGRGTCQARVAGQEIILAAGEMLAVAPGEVHIFYDSSPDYLHFVIQVPFVKGDKITGSHIGHS
jgi:quercetin dioxygenase-like cupin family protein